MENMVENPTSLVVVCAIAFAFLVAFFVVTRSKIWIYISVLPVLVAAGFLIADYAIVSPREEVQKVVDEAEAAIAANDPERLLAILNPEQANATRSRVHWAFSRFDFTGARANDVQITINKLTIPMTAEAKFYAVVHFRDKNGTFGLDKYACRMTVQFEKRGDRWLVDLHKEYNLTGEQEF